MALVSIDELRVALPALTAIEENARRARNVIQRIDRLKKDGVRQTIQLDQGDSDSEVQVAEEQLEGQLAKATDAIAAIKRDGRTLP